MESTEGQGMWGVTFSTQASTARECVLPRGFLPCQTFSVLLFSKGRPDQKKKKRSSWDANRIQLPGQARWKHAGTGS